MRYSVKFDILQAKLVKCFTQILPTLSIIFSFHWEDVTSVSPQVWCLVVSSSFGKIGIWCRYVYIGVYIIILRASYLSLCVSASPA